MSFEEIYREYAENILNLAFKITGREDVARDLTQDIFLKVYQNLDSFRGQSQIYTWLYRIALNHIFNYLKKEKRYRWIELLDTKIDEALEADDSEAKFSLHSSPVQPDKEIEKSQREKIVWAFILELPLKQRVPFILHRYEGLSYQEIAEQLQISLSNVESRIHRAKKFLVNKLKPWVDKI